MNAVTISITSRTDSIHSIYIFKALCRQSSPPNIPQTHKRKDTMELLSFERSAAYIHLSSPFLSTKSVINCHVTCFICTKLVFWHCLSNALATADTVRKIKRSVPMKQRTRLLWDRLVANLQVDLQKNLQQLKSQSKSLG